MLLPNFRRFSIFRENAVAEKFGIAERYYAHSKKNTFTAVFEGIDDSTIFNRINYHKTLY